MSNLVVISEEDLKKIINEAIFEALQSDGKPSARSSKFGQPHKRFLDINELSEFLGIPVKTLYQYNCNRKIPYIRRFRKVIYDWEQIEKWLYEGSYKTLK